MCSKYHLHLTTEDSIMASGSGGSQHKHKANTAESDPDPGMVPEHDPTWNFQKQTGLL